MSKKLAFCQEGRGDLNKESLQYIFFNIKYIK